MRALYGKTALAQDVHLSSAGKGFGGTTLAYNVRQREDIDAVLIEARAAVATMLKPAEETDWGRYAGYCAAPDGAPWEVAWNPSRELRTDGSVQYHSDPSLSLCEGSWTHSSGLARYPRAVPAEIANASTLAPRVLRRGTAMPTSAVRRCEASAQDTPCRVASTVTPPPPAQASAGRVSPATRRAASQSPALSPACDGGSTASGHSAPGSAESRVCAYSCAT